MLTSFFQNLEGQWAFSRLVAGNVNARAAGEAFFTKQNTNRFSYHEKGRLITDQKSLSSFSRHYDYELAESKMHVFYGKGDAQAGELYQTYEWDENLHMLLPVEPHVRRANKYNSTYEVNKKDTNSFALLTSVKGESRDYDIKTDFIKLTLPE